MFKWLETFKVVYETKNFSKASEILFISQPTVSAQIKQLENEFGTQLFIRSGRKEVLVTPQADILYERAVDLMNDWESRKGSMAGERKYIRSLLLHKTIFGGKGYRQSSHGNPK